MVRHLLPLALLLGAQAAPDATPITVTLSSFEYTPSVLTLDHGQSYVLHLVNSSGGGHDFAARKFFAAARIAPEDQSKVAKGEVELGGGESADIHFVAPAPGTYKVHCSHFMHAQFGMTGRIVVR